MKNRQRLFSFDCPYALQKLKEKLPLVMQNYCRKTGTGVLLENAEDGFSLGLERMGHGGGYWYQAKVEEREYGCIICGEIKCLPEEEIPRKKKTFWQKVGCIFWTVMAIIPVAVIITFMAVVWSLILAWNFFIDLFTKKRRNRVRKQLNMAFPPSREKVLREIMCELGCTEIIEGNT